MSLVIEGRDVGSAGFGTAAPFYGNHLTGKRDDRSVGGGQDEDGYASDAASSESSCIGETSSVSLGSSSSEEEEEGSKTARKKDCFDSMDSLDGSLPITRGLSNFFNGKSKSFATLSDVVTSPVTVADLAKPENPFNKKRRILMANKARWPRRASCGSLNTALPSLPPLPPVANSAADLFSLVEEEEEEGDSPSPPFSSSHARKINNFSFRSPRSFSVGDLQRHVDC